MSLVSFLGIYFQRDTSGNDAGEIYWQVVSWNGASVQNGSFSITIGSGTNALQSSVLTDRSFLISSYICLILLSLVVILSFKLATTPSSETPFSMALRLNTSLPHLFHCIIIVWLMYVDDLQVCHILNNYSYLLLLT